MHRFLLFLATILVLSSAFSQGVILRGQLLSERDEPVPFAAVVLSASADSSLVKAATSDMEGRFALFGVPAGSYFLQATSVGFESASLSDIEVGDRDVDIPTISMNSSMVSLDAVTIKAERPMIEVMADKTVFNVENAGGTAGLSGFELLRRAPGVVVDNQDNVMVDGQSGIEIWIDGKPSVLSGQDLTNYLRTIQAADIESIEVITQPSSKYDAEGTAGIINIKLRKDRRFGINGNVSSGVAYGRFWKQNNGLALNYRDKGFAVYMNYSNRFEKSFNFMEMERFIEGVRFDQDSETIWNNDGHNLKLGGDVFLSKKSTIGLSLDGNTAVQSDETESITLIGPSDAGTVNNRLVAGSNSSGTRDNLQANLNYRFEDTLGHKFSTDFDYAKFIGDRTNDQPNEYFDESTYTLLSRTNYRMVTPIDIELQSAKMDYEQQLFGGTFGLGVKGSDVVTKNTFNFFTEENGELEFTPEQSNDFRFDERILAAYVNYAYRKNKWSFQTGLRMENTNSVGILDALVDTGDDRVERDYTDWFPSGGLTYQYHQSNSLALNYSRRISRPNYENLNPFEFRINELALRRGNPFLQPNYAQNIKLTHTHKYTLSTSVTYSYVTDFFAEVSDTLTSEVSFIQTRNVSDMETVNLGLSYPFQMSKWWSVYLNMNFTYIRFISKEPNFVGLDRNNYNMYMQNTFSLPKDWKFEVSGWFSSPGVWGGTWRTQSQGSLDLALSRKFIDDRLSVSVNATDILFTAPWRANAQFGSIQLQGGGGWESRQVRLNLTYNFGNPELKGIEKRKKGAESELQRVG